MITGGGGAAPVVPIAPGVQVEQPRSVALLEFVTQSLAAFEHRGNKPLAIAFFIYGGEGKHKSSWMAEGEIGEESLLALASVHLARCATDETEDDDA